MTTFNPNQKMNSEENNEIEALPPSSLEAITRGEIDVQIATAHKFPRSMQQFKSRAIGMATIDEETAASCIYSRPVGKENGKPKYAEGLSIRMAEIVGASYGNLRVGAMIIEQTPRQVKARGFAHDLEANFAASSEVIEATIKRDGTPYDERMRVVIAKAALSKARRDATFMVVPKALCKPVETECRRVALGDAKTISTRRAAVVAWLGKLGIDLARVWAALGIKGEEDISVEVLATLTGLKTAMKDGEVKADEAFPPLGEREEGGAPKFVPPNGDSKKKPKSPDSDELPMDPPADSRSRVAALMERDGIDTDALRFFLRRNEEGDFKSWEEIPEKTLAGIEHSWETLKSQLK
jgi:hypothetical protein